MVSDGTGNRRLPRPSFTYTKTFRSAPASPTTTLSSVVVTPGFTQLGSESIRTTAAFGAGPSNVILPAMLPAVAASTGLTVGAGVSGAVLSEPPPPHAAANSVARTAV